MLRTKVQQISRTTGDYGSEHVVETILDEPLIQKGGNHADNNISESIPSIPCTIEVRNFVHDTIVLNLFQISSMENPLKTTIQKSISNNYLKSSSFSNIR